MRTNKLIISFILLVFIINCFALTEDEAKKTIITADGEGTYNSKTQEATLNGNVLITRGSLKIHADKGIISQSKEGDKIIILYGSPVTFEQLDDNHKKIEGQGNNFTYNSKKNLAILKGRARIKQDNNTVIGDNITYNTKTQVYYVNSGFENGFNKKEGSKKITIIIEKNEKTTK